MDGNQTRMLLINDTTYDLSIFYLNSQRFAFVGWIFLCFINFPIALFLLVVFKRWNIYEGDMLFWFRYAAGKNLKTFMKEKTQTCVIKVYEFFLPNLLIFLVKISDCRHNMTQK